jgi:hypothetical protein
MFSLQRYKLYTIYRNFFTEKVKSVDFYVIMPPFPPRGSEFTVYRLPFTVYCLIRTMNREP